jgi:hypothetical protein
MMSNKYYKINYEMCFYNKLIWSHKSESHLLKTRSNRNHFTWHATYDCILFESDVLFFLTPVQIGALCTLLCQCHDGIDRKLSVVLYVGE